MNGTALYQGVATIFLAQVYGIDLSAGALMLLVVVAVGASIGSPATPGVGIVILAMVLGTVGIPASGIALLLGVDRILDMCRTAVNVAGDLVACLVMDKWVGGPSTHEEEERQQQSLQQKRSVTNEDVIVREP
jgi:Na+/H+-dicarboxylate symporter